MKKTLHRKGAKMLAVLTVAAILGGCGGSGAQKTSVPGSTNQETAAGTVSGSAKEASAGTEAAESWKPDLNTITFRVANAAGGNADLLTRLIAKAVQEEYGVTAVVQNITGSSGFLMATDLASYDPSPCELMLGTDALFAIAPLFNPSIQISLDDYEILYGSDASSAPSTLAVPATLGVKTWEEFVEYAKTNRILAASNTPGGLTHLQVTALMGAAGIEFTSVTDSGGNKNVLSCLNGDANCVMVNTSVLDPYVESGQLVPLVQFNKEAFEWKYGTIPSVTDMGYDIALESANAMCVRKGADEAGVKAMAKTITDYLTSEKGIADAKEINTTVKVMDSETAKQHLQETIETAKRLKETYYK